MFNNLNPKKKKKIVCKNENLRMCSNIIRYDVRIVVVSGR